MTAGPAERRRQALRDLAELEEQVAAGEIEDGIADRLAAVYRTEAEEAERELGSTPAADVEPSRSRRRAAVGVSLMVVAALGIALFASRSLVPRPPGGFVTGASAEGRELSDVTDEEMEEVLAANPGVTPMRLALANRYFESGDFSDAVRHYLVVLEQQPETPQALARVGWMAHASGEPEVAARYQERALELAPEYAEAKWFLANIYLDGLGRPADAVTLLEDLASLPDLPDDVAERVGSLLERARQEAAG